MNLCFKFRLEESVIKSPVSELIMDQVMEHREFGRHWDPDVVTGSFAIDRGHTKGIGRGDSVWGYGLFGDVVPVISDIGLSYGLSDLSQGF